MKRLLEAKENTRRGAKRGLGLLLALLLLASVMTVPGYAWITATTELSSADSVTAYFYVPETIYLNPDGRTFRYYVGSDKNGNWSNATAEKETGTVYFSAPGATDAEVSWELLGGGGVNMIAKNPGQSAVPLDNADAANTTDGTWSGTIADGSLSSGALAQNEQRTIEWKAEFKYDHDGDPGTAAHDYVAYAYTVIYAPFYEEAGQFGEARYSLIGTDPEVAQMYSFISGLHGVAGGDRTRPYSKWFNGGDLKGKPAMEEYKSGYLGSDTDGAGDPKDSRSAAWFPVKQGGGITQHYGTTDSNSPVESNPDNASFGLITVDKSRYSNLGQVPNLFAGLTYFYGSTLHTNVIKYIGVDGSASLVLASDVTAQSPNKTNGSFAHGPFLFSNFPVEERVYTLQFWARQQNNQDIGIAVIPWVLHTKQYVKLSVHTVDKAALRSNYRQLTALALDTDDLAQKGYQDELREKTQKLGEVLGNPLASQARIDSVYEGTAALISEIREAMPEAEGLIPRAQGQVTVPEAVYLSPKDASVFTVMTFDRAGSENPNKVPTVMPDATEATNIARTGNAADSVVRFTLPAAWNTTAVRNTMKIKYSTVGKDGTTEDKNIVTDLKINGTALTYDTFATYPGGAQDTEFSLRFSGVANTGGDPATLYKEGGIRWTFQFTYNNVAYETYAATWVHPTPVTQAGVMERLEYQGGSRNGGLSNFYAFVTGIHSASGGSARSAFVAANGNELASPLRVEPNLTTNYGYGWGDSEWGGALLGNGYPTSGGWDNPGVTGAWGGRISTFRDNQANNPVHYEARFNTAFPPVDGGGGIWNNPSNGYYYRFSGNSDQDRWTAMQGDGGIPRAQIAVDSSRYSAYTQLPFFSAGAQLFDWYDPDDHPIEYEIDEFREVQTDATRAWKTDTNALVFVADTLTNPASHDASRALSLLLKEEGTNGAVSRSAAAGLKSPEQGSIASTVGLDSKLLCIDNSMQWEQNASNNRTNGDRRRVWYYVWLDTNVVNKGTLRTNVWTANQIFRPAEMFDEAKYAPYREDMWRGALELGRVMLPAGKTAVQWNNEMNALAGELALTAAPDGKTGYDGEPVANLGTIVGEPKTAWDHLYQWFTKIEDGQPVADKGQAPLAAFGTSIGYVQHVKKSNGHPFYAENYGVFSEVTEQQYNEIYKDMFTEYVPAAEDDPETPEDETAEAHSVPPPPWETGLLYAPGDNGGVGRLFYPEEYYIEENGEAEILHPLVTPTYGGYTGVPPDAPADATEPAKLAWGAQWAAFRAAYPQYPDGSYRVVETGGVRRLVALEEQPGNRAVYDQRTEWYASGSEVTLGEGSPAGFRFYDDDGKADLTRWGPYTGNAGKGAPEGNLLLPGNGFGTYGTDDEAAFNGESKLDIEIDPAAAADTPVSEAAQQTREAALVYPMIAGSVRYDLRYEPIRPGYRYTSEGKIFVEAASEEEEDYYGREYADGDHEYYTKYTVNCAYPTEDVPVGKTFAGWISSADGNIYNADSETDPEDKYPDSFVWLSTEDITFTPAFSEIKVDFTIEGNGGTFSILGGTGLEYAGFSIEVPGREGPWSGTLDQKMAIYTDAQPEGGVASLRTTEQNASERPTIEGVTLDTRRGYDFAGWRLEPGTDAEVAPNALYNASAPAKMSAGPYDFTFGTKSTAVTAMWKPQQFKVNYYDAGGSTLVATNYAVYGEPYRLLTEAEIGATPGLAVPTGMRLAGWKVTLVPDAQYEADKKPFDGKIFKNVLTSSWSYVWNNSRLAMTLEAVYEDLKLNVVHMADTDLESPAWTYSFAHPETGELTPGLPALPYTAGGLTEYGYDRMVVEYSSAYTVYEGYPTYQDDTKAFTKYSAKLERYDTSTDSWLPAEDGDGIKVEAEVQPGETIWNTSGKNPLKLNEAIFQNGNNYRIALTPEFEAPDEDTFFDVKFDLNLTGLTDLDDQPMGVSPEDLTDAPSRSEDVDPDLGWYYEKEVWLGKSIAMTKPSIPLNLNTGGYVFDGWYYIDGVNNLDEAANNTPAGLAAAEGGGYTTSISYKPASSPNFITLQARWVRANNVKLAYDPNGGLLTPPSGSTPIASRWVDTASSVSFGDPYVGVRWTTVGASDLNPTRAGYRFTRWAVAPDANPDGTTFTDIDPFVENGKTMQHAPVVENNALVLTVYALWEAISPGDEGSAKVLFDLNGGIAEDLPTTAIPVTAGAAYGEKDYTDGSGSGVLPIGGSAPRKAGYRFVQWDITNETTPVGFKTEDIQASDLVLLPSPAVDTIQLQAQWEAIDPTDEDDGTDSAKLIYHLDGGAFAPMPSWSEQTAVAYTPEPAPANEPCYILPVQAEMKFGVITTPIPTWLGWTFDGWYTQPGGSGTEVEADTPLLPTDAEDPNIHIYAKWTVDSDTPLTVVFHPEGGTPETIASWETVAGSLYSSRSVDGSTGLPSVTRAGYYDDGTANNGVWFTTKTTGGRRITDTDTVTVDADSNGATIHLYKRWTAIPNGIKVYFHPNAQVDGYEDEGYSATAGSTIYSELVDPELWDLTGARPGWTFNGWKIGDDGATLPVDGETTTVSVANDAAAPLRVDLYGQWTAASGALTIARNTRGGVAMADIQNVTATEEFSTDVDLGTPVRAGYTFVGWATYNPDAEDEVRTGADLTAAIAADPDLTVDYLLQIQNRTNLTVWAIWEADADHMIKLIFDAKGGATPTSSDDDVVLISNTSGEAYILLLAGSSLPGDPPLTSRLGYNWDGEWYYADGAEVDWENFRAEADNPGSTDTNPSCTVYAKWTGQGAIGGTDVYWEGQGGIFSDADSASRVIWHGLTAGEALNTYAGFDGLPQPTRNGYTFAGWYTTPQTTDAGAAPVADGSFLVAPGTTDAGGKPVMMVHAIWTPVAAALRIKFDLNQGVVASGGATQIDPIDNVTAEALYSTLSGFDIDDVTYLKRAGYTFKGWYQDIASIGDLTDSSKLRTSTDPIRPAADAAQEDGYYVITLTAKWVLEENGSGETLTDNIVVIWHPNGGTPTTDTVQRDYNAGTNFHNIPSFTRPGYSLTYWYSVELRPKSGDEWRATTDQIGNETPELQPGLEKETGGDYAGKYVVNITPTWEADTNGVTLRFDPNGGTAIEDDISAATAGEVYGDYMDTQPGTEDGVQIATNPETRRAGYNFTGWTRVDDDETLAGPIADDDAILPNLSTNVITLQAQWAAIDPGADEENPTPGSIKILYDVNGGSAMQPRYAKAGDAYNPNGDTEKNLLGPDDLTVRPGFALEGWYLTETPEGIFSDPVTDGSLVTPADASTEEITLHAKWMDDPATSIDVVFDSQGGTAVSTKKENVAAGAQYGQLPTTNRAGYTFGGWYPLPQSKTSTEVTALSYIEPKDFQPEGYEREGSKITLTLFAHWAPIENGVTVRFSYLPYSDKTTVQFPSKTVTAGGTFGVLPSASLEGYKVHDPDSNTAADESGWYMIPATVRGTAPVLGPQSAGEIMATTTVTLPDPTVREITLYLHLEAIENGVTVKLHTGTDDPTAQLSQSEVLLTNGDEYYSQDGLKEKDVPGPLGAVTGTRTGYSFDGKWYATPEGSRLKDASALIQDLSAEKPSIVSPDSPKDLYASWTANVYTVHFVVGTEETGEKAVTYDALYGALPTPVVPGYVFNGWFTSAEGGEQITAGNTVKTASNHTLYAQMEPDSGIVVTFDPQGGEVSPAQIEVSFALPYGTLPTPTKAGYNFLGWYSAANAQEESGLWVSASTEVTNPESHTLYAQWAAKADIIVIFDPCGGVVAPGFKPVTFGEAYGTLPVPIRANAVFVGWYTDAEGGTLVEEDYLVEIPVTHVLYAHWRLLPAPPAVVPVVLPVVIPVGGCACGSVNCGADGCFCGRADCVCVSGLPVDPYPNPSEVDVDVAAPEDGEEGDTAGSEFPDTGDSSGIAMFAALALTGALAAAFSLRKRKKDGDEA